MCEIVKDFSFAFLPFIFFSVGFCWFAVVFVVFVVCGVMS